MEFLFAPGFARSLQKKPPEIQENAHQAVRTFWRLVHREIKTPPAGLGLKHLRGNKWEIRAGIRERVFLQIDPDKVIFLFIGNHDDIRRLLRRY